MKTAQLLISDTHFGVKNNSLTWLESQLLFFDNQVFPMIDKLQKEFDEVSVVHCGDLFDSKSSVNLFVWKAVKTILEKLCSKCKHVFILAGNHDYYSNTEQEYNINSLESFKNLRPNLYIVENDGWTYKPNENTTVLFSPWFEFNNHESLEIAINRYQPSYIFTHTDLENLSYAIKEVTKGIPIISGHIHYPFKLKDNICLGSCYGLTFNDCNQPRYYWVMQDWDLETLVEIANTNSIQFLRLKNGEPIPENAKSWDKIELYLDKNDYRDGKFDEYIKEANELFSDCKTILVENTNESSERTTVSEGFDIQRMIRESIPENLKEKFKIVEENYNKVE